MGHGDGQAECRYPLQIRHTETRRDPINKPNPRAFQTSGGNKERRPDWLAGAGGFEPPHGGIKNRCIASPSLI